MLDTELQPVTTACELPACFPAPLQHLCMCSHGCQQLYCGRDGSHSQNDGIHGWNVTALMAQEPELHGSGPGSTFLQKG